MFFCITKTTEVGDRYSTLLQIQLKPLDGTTNVLLGNDRVEEGGRHDEDVVVVCRQDASTVDAQPPNFLSFKLLS